MIVCKSQAELEKMHRAGLVIWEVLNELRGMAQPGSHAPRNWTNLRSADTAELKVRPAFKSYRGYPASLCTSINSEVVHGIPSKSRRCEEGDIISLDFGVELRRLLRGCGGDGSGGEDYAGTEKLLQVTRESLDRAIDKVRAGQPAGGYFGRGAGVGRAQERLFGGPRFVRPRHRNADS